MTGAAVDLDVSYLFVTSMQNFYWIRGPDQWFLWRKVA